MTRTFNKHQKRCNSNDTNSRFKTVAGELRAKLVSVSCGGRRSGGARTLTPEPRRWCGGTRGTCRVADGRRRGLAGQHTDTPTDWRPPPGLRGLAGQRADAPSHTSAIQRRRCGGRRRVRRAWPRCRWAVTGPGRATHRHPDRLEAAARPAGPGRASSRRAERSSRRGRRAGGQATRRPEICRGNKQQLAARTASGRPEHQRDHSHKHAHERRHRHRHDKAGRNLSVPARPRCSVAISGA